jgi:hypothetical protein
LLGAIALVVTAIVGPLAQPSHALLVWAGACPLTLSASSSPLGPLPSHPATVSLAGGGDCVTNVGLVRMTISGLTLTTNAGTGGFGCFAGIAVGQGTVMLSDPSFPFVRADFTALNVGGVVAMVAVAGNIVFDGASGFAIDPVSLAACAAGTPMTQSSWTGVMAFQDPVLP